MALLRRISAAMRAKPIAVLTLFGLSVTSCVLVDSFSKQEKKFAFSHRIHIVDQGLGCADCHRNWEKNDDPGMPSAKQCALCHEELDAEKPDDHKVASLFVEKKFKTTHAIALGGEIKFSHQQHAMRDNECGVCHSNIEKNEVVGDELAFGMDTCSKCHEQRQVKNDCAQCHSQIRDDAKPPSHTSNWKRLHGRAVRADTGATAQRCELCHKESSCETCHMAETPENHTNYFRRRGHGIVASMDRQTCAACHTPDSCDRCHRETQPQNHGGGWGAPKDRHCITCHEPLRNETCFVCHKDTASHSQATPLPPDHNAGMNCRMCHGNGQPLPHFDNGEQCTICHQ
jgi:hypothetical protein